MQRPEAEGGQPSVYSVTYHPQSPFLSARPCPGPGRGLSLCSQNNLFPCACHHTALQKSVYLIVEPMKAQLCSFIFVSQQRCPLHAGWGLKCL